MLRFQFTLFFTFFLACTSQNQRFNKSENYSFQEKAALHYKLDNDLNEISGLAVDKADRIFAHNDEIGIIYQLDPKSGSILKSFQIGEDVVKADFEGIAIADSTFFLVSSDAIIYEFNEGKDKGYVEFNSYRTKLKTDFNIEGLCYDPSRNSLLLLSKGTTKKYKNKRPVWEFSLTDKKILDEPLFLLDVDLINSINMTDKNFGPSGIEIHPLSKVIYIIAYRGLLILSLNHSGEILTVDKLTNHKQPEGITFLSNGNCLIADERNEKAARLSIYTFKDTE